MRNDRRPVMFRPVVLAACIAVVIILGATGVVAWQIATNASSPDWEGMHQSGNAAYLANVSHMQKELERFKSDRYSSEMLRQMLGTEYSCVGRYQKALEFFDRPNGRK